MHGSGGFRSQAGEPKSEGTILCHARRSCTQANGSSHLQHNDPFRRASLPVTPLSRNLRIDTLGVRDEA